MITTLCWLHQVKIVFVFRYIQMPFVLAGVISHLVRLKQNKVTNSTKSLEGTCKGKERYILEAI